jgi:hypothetical protein
LVLALEPSTPAANRAPDPNVKRAKETPKFMNTSIMTEHAGPTHEQVALLAYQLWTKAGCQYGHDVDYWLQAEKQLNAFLAKSQRQTPETRATANNNSRGG